MVKSLKFNKIYIFSMIAFLIVLITVFFYTPPQNSISINSEINANFFFIFSNNIKVALLMIFCGPLTLGVGTIGILLFNSAILGGALGAIKNEPNLLSLLVPHGIIEVPILIYAASVGIHLFINLIYQNFSFKKLFFQICIVIIGLLIAAGVESFITPIFLKGG